MLMTKRKEEILEFAKELYLTPDEAGNHRHSLQDICDEIKRKLNDNYTKATILNWARKYGWDKLWEQAVKEGITRSNNDAATSESKSLDERYREAIANRKHDDFVMATSLKTLGYNYIMAKGYGSTLEALKGIETGMKYTQDLEDDSKNELLLKVVFEDDGDTEDK